MSTKKLRSLLAATAVASASLVGGSGLAYANLSDNVHSGYGGADCTTGKECVKKVGDTAEVSYDIKVAPLVMSSDHVQTARGFQILVPEILENVKITLTGVPDSLPNFTAGNREFKPESSDAVPESKPVNINIPIEDADYSEVGENSDPYEFQNLPTKTSDGPVGTFIKNYIPAAERGKATPDPEGKYGPLEDENSPVRRMAGLANAGVDPSTFPEQPNWVSYISGLNGGPGVYNFTVTGTVKTVAEDTYVPIRVENKLWRCSQEANDGGSYEEGCQSLKDFTWGRTGELPPVSMAGQSEETRASIKKAYELGGSVHGLSGFGNCAVTANTARMNTIGNDIEGSMSITQSYMETFNLHDNPAVTYIMPTLHEDGCDTGFFHIDLCDEEEKPTDTPATTPSTEPEETTSTTTTPTEPEDEDSLLDKLFPIIPVKPTEPTESTTTSTPTTSSSVPSTTSTAPSTTSTPMTSSTTPSTSSTTAPSTVTSTSTAPSTHTSQSVTETIKESHSETATIVIAPEKAIDDKPKAQPAKNAGPRITTGGSLR